MLLMNKRRISQIELLYKADSVKTFDHETYVLKGTFAVNDQNGDIKNIADIYYSIRTAINKRKDVIAKRKHADEELSAVTERRVKAS